MPLHTPELIMQLAWHSLEIPTISTLQAVRHSCMCTHCHNIMLQCVTHPVVLYLLQGPNICWKGGVELSRDRSKAPVHGGGESLSLEMCLALTILAEEVAAMGAAAARSAH